MRVGLDREYFIDLLVELAVAGRGAVKSLLPEAGAMGPDFTASRRPRRIGTEDIAVEPAWRQVRPQPTLNMWPTCPWRRGAE